MEEASMKRSPRMDTARGTRYRRNEEETSFFFTHFPKDHGAKEMYHIFSLYGKVTKVVIPSKRDKTGKRFGFVRFLDVWDPKIFATKLDNIIIGSTKIHVNQPRFTREWYNSRPHVDEGKMGVNGHRQGREVPREAREDRKGKRMVVDGEEVNAIPRNEPSGVRQEGKHPWSGGKQSKGA